MKIKKPTSKQIRQLLKDNFFWFAGCSIYAISVNCFAVPNNIAQSGVTGLAIVANHLIDAIPLGVMNFLLNIPLIILSLIFLGKAFVGKTLWVIMVLSAMLDVWGRIIPVYEGDRILAALFSGVLSGIGLATVLVTGATSGGTDIVARLLHKAWPHISVGRVMLGFDALVVALAAIAFKSFESALYAVVVIYVSTRVIDMIIYGMGNGKQLLVITDKGREIAAAITEQTTRGVTIVPVEGGYTGTERLMLVCVVRAHEVSKMNRIIHAIDPNTFIIVSEANEILGKGFKKTI